MKRVRDERYGKYLACTVIKTGIDVKCPTCSKHGIVSKEKGIYQFRCPNPMGTMRTQADNLPTFMKLGKNRDKIVKILKRMQEI